MTEAIPTLWQRLYYTPLRDLVRGRFDASLDWRLIVAEAALPNNLSQLIGQVVRQTRLWRREKVAVASELVAHFQDGLDAGRSPDELVKSFGDSSQAAQLIRRAKKRGRSSAWQLGRYACWVLGAIIVAYVATGLYMTMDRPSITTDYIAILNERAAAVPEDERAWPLYRDSLLELNVKPVELDPSQPFLALATSKPGDADWPKTEKYLAEHAGSLAKLREAAARPVLGFVAATSHAAFSEEDRELFGVSVTPEEVEAQRHLGLEGRWVISTLLPYLNLLRSSSALLAADARRAAIADDGQTALDDIQAVYRISRHCEEIPTMVGELVAEAVQQQARAATRDVLVEHPNVWTNSQLRDLAHGVAASQLDWKRGFIGERASFYDSMQRIYTDDGNGDGRLALNVTKDQNLFELLNSVTNALADPPSTPLSNSALAVLAMPAANLVVASRKEMTDTYERFSCRAAERLDTPLWETADDPSMDEDLLAMQTGPLSKFRYLFVNLLLPAYDSLRNGYAKSQGDREGVLIGLALELYHREHGNWPATLAELSPRWLPKLPVDRITGEPLNYKIIDDRPVVYSMGVDSDDDDGRLPAECNGDPHEFRVSEPYEIPAVTTDHVRNWHDGDWVIWSVLPPNTTPADTSAISQPGT